MQYALFLVFASLLGAACSDSPVANTGTLNDRNPPPAPVPATSALSGRILVRGMGADRTVELRDDHGDVFRLLGNEAIALANVDGGDVVVWGTWDASPGLVVSKFKLTGMNGRPALDGVLEAIDNGFAIRLNDGSIRGVPGLSAECVAYVGSRVWVVGFEDGSDVRLGVIRCAIVGCAPAPPPSHANKAAPDLRSVRRTLEGVRTTGRMAPFSRPPDVGLTAR